MGEDLRLISDIEFENNYYIFQDCIFICYIVDNINFYLSLKAIKYNPSNPNFML